MKRRALLFAIGVGLALCGRLSAEVPGLVEWHRTTLFRFLTPLTQSVAQLTRGSFGELLAGLLAAGAVIALLRTRGRVLGLIALSVGLAILAFYLLWGVAYQFPPLEGRLEALTRPGGRDSPPSLIEVTEQVVALVGRTAAPPSPDSVDDRLRALNEALLAGFQRLPGVLDPSAIHGVKFSPVKVSRVSFALSRLQLSGYYFPWTGEALINGAMPASLWPRVAAHEIAHQRGIARENEATVMGVLACLASRDPAVVYSGALGLFASLDHDLARANPDEHRRLWALLPQRARDDFRNESAFWKSHEGPAGVVSESVNDAYLKAQGVPAGVASYSDTTSLFLLAAQNGVVSLDRLPTGGRASRPEESAAGDPTRSRP